MITAKGFRKIIFIGDSLIEWFDWQERYPSLKVVNLGISGETVEMLLHRLPRVIEAHPDTDVVVLMTGINNVAMEDMGIIAPYGNILKLITQGWPTADVRVTSLLPTFLPWIQDNAIRNLNALLSELAGDTGAYYDDIYSLFMAQGARECLLEDGIHISSTGYEVWSGALAPALGAEGGAGCGVGEEFGDV